MPSRRHLNPLKSVADAAMLGRSSPVRERMRKQAVALATAENLVDAAWSYRLVPLSQPVAETLHLEGETLHAPWLIPASGQLTGLACGVCTVGPALEARVSTLFAEKRASLALALDELGNELLFASSRLLQDRMLIEARRERLSLCGELHPGDPGLGLDAHAAILRLAQAQTIGITLRYGHTLFPLKSSSVVMGVGIDLPKATWSRCDHCPSRSRCKLAQREAAAN